MLKLLYYYPHRHWVTIRVMGVALTDKPLGGGSFKVTQQAIDRCRVILVALRTIPEAEATVRRVSDETDISTGSLHPLIAALVEQGAVEVAGYTVPAGSTGKGFTFRLSAALSAADAAEYSIGRLGTVAQYAPMTSRLPPEAKTVKPATKPLRTVPPQERTGAQAARRMLPLFMSEPAKALTRHEAADLLGMPLETAQDGGRYLLDHGLVEGAGRQPLPVGHKGGRGRSLYRLSALGRTAGQHFVDTGEIPKA